MAGPPGFEPGTTNSAGWRLIQARLRPHLRGGGSRLIKSSLRNRAPRLQSFLQPERNQTRGSFITVTIARPLRLVTLRVCSAVWSTKSSPSSKFWRTLFPKGPFRYFVKRVTTFSSSVTWSPMVVMIRTSIRNQVPERRI